MIFFSNKLYSVINYDSFSHITRLLRQSIAFWTLIKIKLHYLIMNED